MAYEKSPKEGVKIKVRIEPEHGESLHPGLTDKGYDKHQDEHQKVHVNIDEDRAKSAAHAHPPEGSIDKGRHAVEAKDEKEPLNRDPHSDGADERESEAQEEEDEES